MANHLPRIVISTVGNSLLTGQIDRQQEGAWFSVLSQYANHQLADTPAATIDKIQILSQRAKAKLQSGSLTAVRKASAELNGICGIYQEDFSQGRSDIHYLISTDTAQGQETADIIRRYLIDRGIVNVNIPSPNGLSTASTQAFSGGIDGIIEFLEIEVKPLRSNYEVVLI